MGEVFSRVLEMSLYGSIAILAVLLFRLIFKKCPKKILIIFWIVVAVRLIIPFNFNSPTSVLNIGMLFTDKSVAEETVQYDPETRIRDITTEDRTVRETQSAADPDTDPVMISGETETDTVAPAEPADKVHAVTVWTVIPYVWLSVTSALLIFSAIRYAVFYSKAKWSSRSYDGRYYMANDIDSPFVVGIFSPKIFFPFHMDDDEREYVLNHEWIHIKNKDSVTKLISYVILCIHWFNPLVWLAFVMLCADIEMRVDEETTVNFDLAMVKEYCKSLVRHAADDKQGAFMQSTAFSGLGFGGMETKLRIKNLLNSKSTSLAMQITAISVTLIFTLLASASSVNHKPWVKDEPAPVEPGITGITETESVPETSESVMEESVYTGSYEDAYLTLIDNTGSNKNNFKYDLIFVNNDQVPELVIEKKINPDDDMREVSLYTFVNGKVVPVFEGVLNLQPGYESYQYIPYMDYVVFREYENDIEWVPNYLYTMDDLMNGSDPLKSGKADYPVYSIDGVSATLDEFMAVFSPDGILPVAGRYSYQEITSMLQSETVPASGSGTTASAEETSAVPSATASPADTRTTTASFDNLTEGSILRFEGTTSQSYKLVSECGTAEIFCSGTWAKFVLNDQKTDLFLSSDYILSDAYMIRHNGHTFIYFMVINENWIHELNVFRVDNDVVSSVGICQGLVFDSFYTESFDKMAFLEDDEDSVQFGSFGRYYSMSDNGMPVLTDPDMYYINLSMETSAKYNMTGLVIRDGNRTGEEKTINAGEKATPIRVERGECIEIKAEDGTVIIFDYSETFEHQGNRLTAIDLLFDVVYRGG